MRSIPTAMTWEILARGRWLFVLGTLGALALPMLVLTALRHDGLVDPRDPSMLIMNIVMLNCAAFFFGTILFSGQGRMSQLYAYPARTSELVAWRLFPAMAIVVIQMALYVALLNWMFDLQWPVWAPALFTAVAIGAVMAVAWLTARSLGWQILGITAVSAALGLWFKSRYGNPLLDPTHLWQQMTAGDVFTLLTIAAAAYGVGVFGVSRNRRGEPPLSLGILDWLNRAFDFSGADDARLTTPIRAQCWMEWQRKGWAIPATAFFLLIVGLISWLIASRNAEDLFQGLAGGGFAMCFVGFIGGLLLGNAGPNDGNYTMGHFFATRPISDSDIARAILKTAVKSLLLAWAIWAAAIAIVYVCLWAFGTAEAIRLPRDWRWWYFPAMFLGPWMIAGTLMSLGLLGRTGYLIRSVWILAFVAIACVPLSMFVLSREAQWILYRTIVAAGAVGVVIWSVWIYTAALRCGLIPSATVWAAATVSVATMAVAVLDWPGDTDLNWLGYLLVAAALALTVAPLAAVPLALSWNRHR